MTPPAPERQAAGAFDGRALGVVAVAVTVTAAAALWVLRPPPPARHPSLDLHGWTIPKDQVVVGAPKNAIPTLTDAHTLSLAEAADYRVGRRGKLLVTKDLVIGVTLGGESCAYPIRLLEWHEVVHHTLGGVPLAVTYHPLSGAALVFDRRVDGDALDLRACGLLWQSTQLLADLRTDPAAESLWSPLLGRAVAGAAAGRGARLTRIPAELTHWSDWLARHPETRVLAPDPRRTKLLKLKPYASYYGDDQLRFPVQTLPPPELGYLRKERVLVVERGEALTAFPYRWLAEHADPAGVVQAQVGGAAVALQYLPGSGPNPPAARLVETPADGSPFATPCFWFAWYATHPDRAVLAN